jgi:PTS system mannose-specific IID component
MSTNDAVLTPTTPVATEPRVGRVALLRVLWRSFFFQSACNYERMQNVGFAFCILPALTRLYRGEDLKRAMARHLEFFNSHPYMADALLGATVRMEEDLAAGRTTEDRILSFKATMMGPMAAIGDSFFWASLKPFAAALAVAGVFSDVPWAPLVFLALYNMFHLILRVYGLFAGYRMGERVFEKLCQIDLVQFSDRSHYFAGVCIGVSGGLLVDRATRSEAALGQNLEAVLLIALVLIMFQLLKRKVIMIWLLYGFTLLCLILILGLNSFFPLIER